MRADGVRAGGARVTIGVGAVVGIDVEIGDHCTIGALSFVPKHTQLESGAMYAGIPVRRIEPRPSAGADCVPPTASIA